MIVSSSQVWRVTWMGNSHPSEPWRVDFARWGVALSCKKQIRSCFPFSFSARRLVEISSDGTTISNNLPMNNSSDAQHHLVGLKIRLRRYYTCLTMANPLTMGPIVNIQQALLITSNNIVELRIEVINSMQASTLCCS